MFENWSILCQLGPLGIVPQIFINIFIFRIKNKYEFLIKSIPWDVGEALIAELNVQHCFKSNLMMLFQANLDKRRGKKILVKLI